jgi:hypothetical protein
MELLDTLLVGRDGRTFDADAVFENGVCCVDGDLDIGLREGYLNEMNGRKV